MNPVRTNSDLLNMLFKQGMASVKTDALPEQARELVEHVKKTVAESDDIPEGHEPDVDVIEVEGQEVD